MGHLLTLFGGAQNYAEKVQATPGLIAYWPLDEQSGTVAYDRSGNGRNGTHVGVTLGATGIGDGRTCPTYDGVNDYTNIYSASLAGAFNGAEGTLIAWARVANAAVWTEDTYPYVVNITVDANNFVQLRKYGANTLLWLYKSGGVDKSTSLDSVSNANWMPLGLTWSNSAEAAIAYYNGSQTGTTKTPLADWVGNISSSLTAIGAVGTAATTPWNGNIAHVSLFNRALSPVEIARLSRA